MRQSHSPFSTITNSTPFFHGYRYAVGMTHGDLRQRDESLPRYIADEADNLRKRMKEDVVPAQVWNSLYTNALAQMYSARTTFISSTQNALTTMLGAYTAGAAIVAVLASKHDSTTLFRSLLLVASAGCFLLPILTRWLWVEKIRAGYSIYVMSIIHATVVATATKSRAGHGWIEAMALCGRATGGIRRAKWRNVSDDSISDQWEFRPKLDVNLRCKSFRLCRRCNCCKSFRLSSRYEWELISDSQAMNTAGKVEAVWCSRGRNLLYLYTLTVNIAVSVISPIGFVFAVVAYKSAS